MQGRQRKQIGVGRYRLGAGQTKEIGAGRDLMQAEAWYRPDKKKLVQAETWYRNVSSFRNIK